MTRIAYRNHDKRAGHSTDSLLPTRTVVGRVIREWRLDRQVGQALLAERAGLNPTHVSRLESGARNPSRECLTAIAAALGTDPSPFLIAGGFLPEPIVRQMERGQITPKQVRTALVRGLTLLEFDQREES